MPVAVGMTWLSGHWAPCRLEVPPKVAVVGSSTVSSMLSRPSVMMTPCIWPPMPSRSMV